MSSAELNKWLATIRISWTNYLAYKLNFLLLIIGPVVVFFFIRYNLWSAIYHLEGITTLQGYTFEVMLAYQVWVMVVGFLGMAYNGMSLAHDIRLGRISAYLIYPFSFWKYHTSSFIAFQGIQLVVSAITVWIVWMSGWIEIKSFSAMFHGVFYSLWVGLFWFQTSFLIGILAFWLEQTWVFRVMMMTVSQFLSGAILPLEIFPSWLVSVLNYLPFPYLTYVPVKLFMDDYHGSLPGAYSAIIIWTALIFIFSQWIWKKGLNEYTAAGM